MPLITIWRDHRVVEDQKAVELRDLLREAVAEALKVKVVDVEARVLDVGPFDINYAPVGIEIDTGGGKKRWRVNHRTELVKFVAQRVAEAEILPREWLGPGKSYVWLRVVESAFVPIGFPHLAR